MAAIDVKKFNVHGRLAATWTGEILEAGADYLLLEARWTRSQRLELGYVTFEFGDTFLEYYFPERWFSVWQIGGTHRQPLKGWYCNVCTPFTLQENTLEFTDLVLDVFVRPDGSYLVLDEDELAELEEAQAPRLNLEAIYQARAAVDEIREMVEQESFPFTFQRVGAPT